MDGRGGGGERKVRRDGKEEKGKEAGESRGGVPVQASPHSAPCGGTAGIQEWGDQQEAS